MPRREPFPTSPPPASARDAVCRALSGQAKAFPLLLPVDLGTAALDPREAALAHAIHDSVLRRWLTLSFLLEAASGRDLGDVEPAMRAVLLCGAAQLLLLDRIPPHAAIDESVEWAKRRIRPKAAGITNAILRRTADLIARDPEGAHIRRESWTDRPDEIPMPDGSARVLARDVLPEAELDRLAITTSIPRRVLERWTGHAFARPGPADLPARQVTRALALHTLAPAPTILNTRHAAAPLPPGLAPHSSEGSHIWEGRHLELSALLAARHDLWVQDPSSAASVLLAHAELHAATHTKHPPRVIADVCAGQGTKTRQLAALFPQAEILATDTDADRLATLAAVFKDHPRVRVLPRAELAATALGRCELILLDVPCSNTGVLPRRPEARYRLTDRTLERMADVQRQIGADSIPLLAPKGRILYATCSLEPEENDQMAAWFARWHSLRRLGGQSLPPAGLPGDPPAGYRDGSYAVLLGR